MHEPSNQSDPDGLLGDRSNDQARGGSGGAHDDQRFDPGLDPGLEPGLERDLGDMLRAERLAMDAALRGGAPSTPEELAFMAETRAFVDEQWAVNEPSPGPRLALDSGLGFKSATHAPPTIDCPREGPRLTGRTALLDAQPAHAHDGRPHSGVGAPWVRAAAAALLLTGAGLYAQAQLNDPSGAARTEGAPESPSLDSPKYMGDGNSNSPATESLPPFPTHLDWSSIPGSEDMIFELFIKERGPKRVDEHGVHFRTENPILETTWTCPTDILDSLPDTVDVEIYETNQQLGSAPLWRRSFSAPSVAPTLPR